MPLRGCGTKDSITHFSQNTNTMALFSCKKTVDIWIILFLCGPENDKIFISSTFLQNRHWNLEHQIDQGPFAKVTAALYDNWASCFWIIHRLWTSFGTIKYDWTARHALNLYSKFEGESGYRIEYLFLLSWPLCIYQITR